MTESEVEKNILKIVDHIIGVTPFASRKWGKDQHITLLGLIFQCLGDVPAVNGDAALDACPDDAARDLLVRQNRDAARALACQFFAFRGVGGNDSQFRQWLATAAPKGPERLPEATKVVSGYGSSDLASFKL